MQHLAVHQKSGRLYSLMHQGGPDTHKEPGTELWIYDLARRGVYWVTRAKDNMAFHVCKKLQRRPRGKVLRDDYVDDFDEPVNQNRGGSGWSEAVEQVEAREAEGDGHGEEAGE